MKKWLIGRSYNLKKDFVRFYIKLYMKSNKYL